MLLASALATVVSVEPPAELSTPTAEAMPVERSAEAARIEGRVICEGVDKGEVLVELAAVGSEPGSGVTRMRLDLNSAFAFYAVTPGRYSLRARHGSLVRNTQLDLAAGDELEVELVLCAPVPAIARGPERPALPATRRPRGAIWSHAGDEGLAMRRFGLATTVVGTVLATGALVVAFHNPCGRDGASGADCRVDLRNTAALGLGITALGSLTAGVTLMAVGQTVARRDPTRSRPGARAQLHWGLDLHPGGSGLVLAGRF